jgi:serine/threonine-protein kinase
MTTPIGKYKLVRLIASGGMAEVYLARQAGAAGFEKLVCLKRILPHLARDKQFVEMFLNEARIAARLDHPNIVSIFDLGEANGNYFIAMEFIDGPSLRAAAKRALERGDRLPVPEIVKIVSMAASGLHYAHDLTDAAGKPLGLVHRDISPDNILVHRNGTAKVVDFGIAKAASSSALTRTGTLKGKVAYMPPEQLRGDPLDRRADVFALGVVLYELLGGKRPWASDSDVSLIGRIMTEEPQPLATLRPDVPAGLTAVVDRALAKDRDARHPSCHDLQADLESLLLSLGQTISASRLSDFARSYADPVVAPDESTGAAMKALEAEMNGTGSVPPLPARRGPGPRREPPTVVIPSPPARDRRGVAVGLVAFLSVAAIGGAAGYAWMLRRGELRPDPVPVERAAVVEQPAPKPVAQEPEKPKAAEMEPPAAVSPPAPVVYSDELIPPPTTDAPPAIAAARPPAQPSARRKASAEAEDEEESDEEEPEPAAPLTAKGELVLLIRPWARVEVDGQDVGVTPLSAPLLLAAGQHSVRLVNPELGKDVTRTVRIAASERSVLKELLDE